MLTTVKGHFNGVQIVPDESLDLFKGQEVIITVLNPAENTKNTKVDLKKYMGRGKKMFEGDAQDYVKELRCNDRL